MTAERKQEIINEYRRDEKDIIDFIFNDVKE